MNNHHQPLKIWAGLVTLYLIWGSTYLGIRFVVERVPPFMVSGLRNLIAGSILFVFAILSKNYQKPSRKMWRTTALSGFFMLTIGNGLTSTAAKWVPSSYSALFSASGPVMLILLLWLWNNEKPKRKVMLGAILGILGVGILMSLKTLALKGSEHYYLLGIFLLFMAVLGWNIGVVTVKNANINNYHASQIAGTQMIIGGSLSLIVSTCLGEFDTFHPQNLSPKAIAAFAYLLIFGSIIAFLVFAWLSKVAPPTLVATYTYINPLVAMILGATFANEHLHPLMLLASVIIITAVVLITAANRKGSFKES